MPRAQAIAAITAIALGYAAGLPTHEDRLAVGHGLAAALAALGVSGAEANAGLDYAFLEIAYQS